MREYVEKQLHTRVDCEPNDASEITTQNSFRKCTFLCNKKKPLNQRFFLFRHEKRRPPCVNGRLC